MIVGASSMELPLVVFTLATEEHKDNRKRADKYDWMIYHVGLGEQVRSMSQWMGVVLLNGTHWVLLAHESKHGWDLVLDASHYQTLLAGKPEDQLLDDYVAHRATDLAHLADPAMAQHFVPESLIPGTEDLHSHRPRVWKPSDTPGSQVETLVGLQSWVGSNLPGELHDAEAFTFLMTMGGVSEEFYAAHMAKRAKTTGSMPEEQ